MTLGWGLVGASLIARRWIVGAIHDNPDSRPVAIMSTSPERGREFAQAHDVPRVHRRLEDLLEDDEVDVVYISTRNDLHAEQTIAAAAAGKHVLCEKPLALRIEDARAMRKACADAGVVLGVNHNKRHAPTHRTIRALVEKGTVGEPLTARVSFATYLPREQQTWRLAPAAGAGVTLDLTVHDADILRFLLRDEVAEVTAFTAHQGMASGGVEDAVVGVLRFRSGLLASFHDAFTLAYAGTGLEIHGSEASIVATDVMGDTPAGEVFLRDAEGVRPIDVGEREDLFVRAIRDFNQAVRGSRPPSATAEDGIRSLAVALACLESSRSSRSVAVGEVA